MKTLKQWTEEDINTYLLATRKLADRIKDKKSGDTILNIGTLLFEQWALANNYKNHRVMCPRCREYLKRGIEIEFYKQIGYCMSCDHLLSDRRDYEE
jgi:hypothetical protein